MFIGYYKWSYLSFSIFMWFYLMCYMGKNCQNFRFHDSSKTQKSLSSFCKMGGQANSRMKNRCKWNIQGWPKKNRRGHGWGSCNHVRFKAYGLRCVRSATGEVRSTNRLIHEYIQSSTRCGGWHRSVVSCTVAGFNVVTSFVGWRCQFLTVTLQYLHQSVHHLLSLNNTIKHCT